jgi:hypothetical protein
MLGMLQKGEVDLCIYRMAKSLTRDKVAEFLFPITKVWTLIQQIILWKNVIKINL